MVKIASEPGYGNKNEQIALTTLTKVYLHRTNNSHLK